MKDITSVDRDFFLLLRAGLWQKVDEKMSDTPDWSYIYTLACEQTIQGIVADGIGLYKSVYPNHNLDAQIYNDFLNQAAQIIRQNYKLNQVQTKVCQTLNGSMQHSCGSNGSNSSSSSSAPTERSEQSLSAMQQSCGSPSEAFDPAKPLTQAPAFEPLEPSEALGSITYVILKGQGVAQCYPKPMLRCSGDIDLFFTPENYERAKDILKPLSTSVEDKPLSKECVLTIDDIVVELHGAMESGISDACQQHFNKLKQNIFKEIRKHPLMGADGGGFPIPSANFDAIYILTHAIRHLGSFGISLRQIIDWTMHMHANRDIIDRERLQYDIQQMHLQNLWNLFSSFAVEYLGAPREDFYISKLPPSLGEGRGEASLWQIIAQSGSFGKKNPYFSHTHSGHLHERLARTYYHIKQALKIRQFDTEFSNYLLKKELRDTFVSPFRYLFGGPKR